MGRATKGFERSSFLHSALGRSNHLQPSEGQVAFALSQQVKRAKIWQGCGIGGDPPEMSLLKALEASNAPGFCKSSLKCGKGAISSDPWLCALIPRVARPQLRDFLLLCVGLNEVLNRL
jgi:hypothetical protein